ncbi:hypothetical protein GCM10010503_37590 [Streptomyces lucensis JCM 4490]|uniref:Uncharacterized protein n=1 Tax=Streptomyces lucensis JCM 4490 TaxID=1306176 RepID=A0A918J7N4_9ACTN|nr:hypothetical protein GCM10010503_37590 [Streptomyces lucensis JCM 4490]
MVMSAVWADFGSGAAAADRVGIVSRARKPAGPVADAETAAAAAAFLEGQEITRTSCGQCGTETHGINGRYSCGICGWSNHWSEGHKALPTARDDLETRERPQG